MVFAKGVLFLLVYLFGHLFQKKKKKVQFNPNEEKKKKKKSETEWLLAF